jgi:hypothetical protein
MTSSNDGDLVPKLRGRELYDFKNHQRSKFAKKAIKGYNSHPWYQIPKVDWEKTYLRVNTMNFKLLLGIVVNGIVISSPDPEADVKRCLRLSDEELSKTEVYKRLKMEMEHTHNKTQKKIEEWIARGHMESNFRKFYDECDDDDISVLPNNQLGYLLKIISCEQPVPFKWMWIIYKRFRIENRPRSPMCDCCYHPPNDDDEPKPTFAQFFRDSTFEFYTAYTKHDTYYYNIVDFMRLVYRSILDVQPTTEPSQPPQQESVSKVQLVSDEELLAGIAEIRTKYPGSTSVKSLCQHLKREKPQWQVTETRIKKLPK